MSQQTVDAPKADEGGAENSRRGRLTSGLTGSRANAGQWLSTASTGVRRSWFTMSRTVARVPGWSRGWPITPLGWLVIAATLGAWFFGWLLGWMELSVIATMGVLLLLVSVAFVIGRTSVNVRLKMQSRRVVVGERATGQVEIENTSARRLLPLEVDLRVGDANARFAVPGLAGNAIHEEFIIIPTEHRAVIPIGPARAVRGDALGILRRGVSSGEKDILYVHPKTINLGRLGYGLLKDLEGGESKVISPSDLAFHALREYNVGDDRRHIHWRSSAKVGQMMVRQFVETRRSHMAVILSSATGDYASDEEYELAVSVVGSIGRQALADEQGVTVLTRGKSITAENGQQLLDALSSVKTARRGADLASSAKAMATMNVPASAYVLVTGTRVDPRALAALGSRYTQLGDVLVIRVADSGESTLSGMGGLPLLNVANLTDLPRLMRAVTP